MFYHLNMYAVNPSCHLSVVKKCWDKKSKFAGCYLHASMRTQNVENNSALKIISSAALRRLELVNNFTIRSALNFDIIYLAINQHLYIVKNKSKYFRFEIWAF